MDGKSSSAHAAILASDDVTVYEYPDIPDYSLQQGVVLIFPSHTSTDVNYLFTGIQNLDRSDNFGVPKGQKIGTLLKYKLKELSVNEGTTSTELPTDQTSHQRIQLYDYTNLPVKKAVLIDSTWNQCRSIYKDTRISSMKCIMLQNRLSQFWRHQKGSPRWYLSTVEAIHQFLLEVHFHAWGLDPLYRGLDKLEIDSSLIESSLIDPGTVPEHVTDNGLRPYNGQYDNLLFFFTHMYGLIHTYYDHNKLKAYKRPIT